MRNVRLKLPKDVLERYRAWARFLGKSAASLMRQYLRRIAPAKHGGRKK